MRTSPYGPAATTLEDLVRVAGACWAIKEGFAQVKDLVGLDQYEVRRWPAWYRHITLTLLAHAYLEVTRAQAVDPEQGSGNRVHIRCQGRPGAGPALRAVGS